MKAPTEEISQIDFHCGLAAITVANQEHCQKLNEIKKEKNLNGPNSIYLSQMREEAAILLAKTVAARVDLLQKMGDWPKDQYDQDSE